MEVLIFFLFAAVFAAVIFMRETINDRKKREQFALSLYQDYGNVSPRKYSEKRFAAITGFYKNHPAEGQIDDITWNDLDYDEIFKRLNDTYSSAGEEYLYYTLRTPKYEKEALEHFDEVCEFFRNNAKQRVDLQLLLAKLGHTGKFSLYDYLEHLDVLGQRSNRKHYVLLGLLAMSMLFLLVMPLYGVIAVIGMLIFNMITYFKEKNEIDTYITSFAYIMRLSQAAGEIGKFNIEVCSEELEEIRRCQKSLTLFRTGSFWILSSGRMSGSGNPLDLIMDYLRMTLHLDLIKFNSMLSQVRKHTKEIDSLVRQIGYLETAAAIGAFRTGCEGQWCRPEFSDEKEIEMINGYHPMISNPVKNSISTKKGVLLTGSNASGKSTFLKTVAINAILAQTIATCPAERYRACFYRICSSMALRDDLAGGESYYIVEIKSIKRIMESGTQQKERVLCFVDEVLRGTNTIERIAASAQILQSLSGEKTMCFAATHDIELTELLEEDFDNYHFEESVENGDISFNYKLRRGKAVSRNAIKLLELMGYEKSIVDKAEKQAAFFLQTGVWKMKDWQESAAGTEMRKP